MTGNKAFYDVAIIGGGASGMMAALAAAKMGATVALVERNPKLGRKIYITGKGRCNLTNHCTAEEVLNNTIRNAKFLYSSMKAFPPASVMKLFEESSLPRVCPASSM